MSIYTLIEPMNLKINLILLLKRFLFYFITRRLLLFAGRRIDALEQRVSSHDQSHKNLLEQLLKMQQDVRMDLKKHEHALLEERAQRGRLTQVRLYIYIAGILHGYCTYFEERVQKYRRIWQE